MTTGIESNALRSIIRIDQIHFEDLIKELKKLNQNLEKLDETIKEKIFYTSA